MSLMYGGEKPQLELGQSVLCVAFQLSSADGSLAPMRQRGGDQLLQVVRAPAYGMWTRSLLTDDEN